jgi:hypothetical protein
MPKVIKAALLIFWIASVVLASSGCARTNVYVLNKEELIKVKAGETVIVKFDGWILSQRAVDRVLDAKIKAVNLE